MFANFSSKMIKNKKISIGLSGSKGGEPAEKSKKQRNEFMIILVRRFTGFWIFIKPKENPLAVRMA